jgi:ABC-type amino acid transport system permease subunit
VTELWEVLKEHLPEFSSGFIVTVRLVAISFVIAMVVGTLVAALRVAPLRWLNRVGGI